MIGPEPSDDQWDEILWLVGTLSLTDGELSAMKEWAEGRSPYGTTVIIGWLRGKHWIGQPTKTSRQHGK